MADVDELYNKFGGCILGWVAQSEVWSELQTKVAEVIKSQGDNMLKRGPNSKGSIVHLRVGFDEERPIQRFADELDSAFEQAGDNALENMLVDDAPIIRYNDFEHVHYIFGSGEPRFWI